MKVLKDQLQVINNPILFELSWNSTTIEITELKQALLDSTL